ncbi:unnamed protein product [Brassicogethes aeneus]|uniref:Ig-like domain-containing protein n=1 Tax=Brassicogethes aeneus TaxID=1431903 RepID=A0A9P0BCK4_BRAAE|nr:unnamed protein product [Brassicogethes aeneus]
MFSKALLVFLCVHLGCRTSWACGKSCACKWKNGKQTIECSNRNLDAIPSGFSADMQVLEFSGNRLPELPAEFLLKVQLVNLQRIFLSNCNIRAIHEEAFKGLANLVELDLSNNFIERVPTEAFKFCPALMRLTLNYNPIHALQKFSFNYLTYLNTLELSNCSLFEVEAGAFQGLHSLEWLHLDGNRLKTIPGRKTLPDNIKGVELQHNAWECDCHIQDLHGWLVNFNVPMSSEPMCKGPSRLSGRVIKSIPTADLACLPDVSPTSFYLELSEGKNVSLLCHVHANPEATVSWWFQGRILQNNTPVAPGLHLIYYVEEGPEKKRSELFIYNADADDNGTYVCNAENAAGSTHTNFTVKILLKEDPIVIIVSLPIEYFLVVVGAAAVLGLMIVVVLVVLIFKCHRNRCREEKRKKPTSKPELQDEELEGSAREVNTTTDSDDMIKYGVQPCESSLSPVANQIRSPSSLRRYQLEQNPDLINGTESNLGYRRDGDGADQQGMCKLLETTGLRNIRCVLDSQGYPIDYGLPKLAYRKTSNENYYRTLPCKRLKRHSAANPINRFSREAEYLSRSLDYDYQANVRYTATGYPPPKLDIMGGDLAPSSLPCCSSELPPRFVAANLHAAKDPASGEKRCASAQTESVESGGGCLNTRNDVVNDVLTESPDEGYEGEPPVVV